VPRRVQHVDHRVAIGELQRRRRDRDTSRLLHGQPVRHHTAPAGLAVHRAGLGDHPRVQRQGLGERRLASVRMTDHRESTPVTCLSHHVQCGLLPDSGQRVPPCDRTEAPT
jgi:hypothetical protein